MNLHSKWHKESLYYSMIFFVAAILWYFWNPVGMVRDLVDSLPNALDIKYILFDLGIFPIFYHVFAISIIGLLFFLSCSIFTGILYLRKAAQDGEKKILGFIPKNAPGFMAILMVFSSSAYFVINVLVATDLLN